ncbi:MAG: hypothetical protein ACTSR8_21350 [Promethearchaeota archaeon]
MKDNEFLVVSQLFDSIAVIEKGIDKIYHYLLIHNRIDNLKEVCEMYELSLKRGYKVASVLNEKGLVNIYDRPMKIQLITPVIEKWQEIINLRIEQLQQEFQNKKNECETSLENFLKKYNIKEEVTSEPVEFISFNVNNFEDMYYPFLAKEDCMVALGIGYENPLISILQEDIVNSLDSEQIKSLQRGISKIQENVKYISIKVIINTEVVTDILSSKEYSKLIEHFNRLTWEFKNLDVRITDSYFSNFSIHDTELIQPSFDPTNKLIGSYISRNKNIYQIFYDKFNELFAEGVPVNTYLKENKIESKKNLSDEEIFALCMF